LVLRAGQANTPRGTAQVEGSQQALEDLCRIYWYPIYAFARQRGVAPEDAKDLVQAFFLDLLERQSFAVADPQRGRFRNFLLTSFRNFHAKQREKSRAAKRGGDKRLISFEREEAEHRFRFASNSADTPEQQFERAWTLDLLQQALLELRESYRARNQLEFFDALQDYLAETTPPPYEQLATQLGKTIGSVRVVLHRMRGRYRAAVRKAVADTISTDQEAAIEGEISALLNTFSCNPV
jgi:RNA polymerase sigma-70 factor (ECF subfamily)